MLIGKNILNGSLSFIKGIAGGINPVLGAVVGAGEGVVKGIQKEKEKNVNSEVGGVGKVDLPHLLGVLFFIILVIAFIFGYLTMDDLKELVKLLSNFF